MDPNMSKLLKWSLQNSRNPEEEEAAEGQPQQEQEQEQDTTTTTASSSQNDATTTLPPRGPPLDPSALASILLNAPSDAEMMQRSLSAIQSKSDIPLASRLVAWDNLEQLLENLDNANNLDNLRMWEPLREELAGAEEVEEREFAAWCVGTSVQNNLKSQDALLKHNVMPVLTRLAISDPSPQVRKKAVFALSSAVRNNQKAVDELVRCLKEGEEGKKYLSAAGISDEQIDAGDMEKIDKLMNVMRGN